MWFCFLVSSVLYLHEVSCVRSIILVGTAWGLCICKQNEPVLFFFCIGVRVFSYVVIPLLGSTPLYLVPYILYAKRTIFCRRFFFFVFVIILLLVCVCLSVCLVFLCVFQALVQLPSVSIAKATMRHFEEDEEARIGNRRVYINYSRSRSIEGRDSENLSVSNFNSNNSSNNGLELARAINAARGGGGVGAGVGGGSGGPDGNGNHMQVSFGRGVSVEGGGGTFPGSLCLEKGSKAS